jgi:hypothetical protein
MLGKLAAEGYNPLNEFVSHVCYQLPRCVVYSQQMRPAGAVTKMMADLFFGSGQFAAAARQSFVVAVSIRHHFMKVVCKDGASHTACESTSAC